MGDALPSWVPTRATAWTTYWRTDRARAGLLHLLYRDGAVNILVPPLVERYLARELALRP